MRLFAHAAAGCAALGLMAVGGDALACAAQHGGPVVTTGAVADAIFVAVFPQILPGYKAERAAAAQSGETWTLTADVLYGAVSTNGAGAVKPAPGAPPPPAAKGVLTVRISACDGAVIGSSFKAVTGGPA